MTLIQEGTLNYLLTTRDEGLMCFSDTLTTLSSYLKGPGGGVGDGFPLPRSIRVYRIDCWDGTNLLSGTANVKFNQGDRISVYALAAGGKFNVEVHKNGTATALVAAGANQNATLWVTVHLMLV